MPTIVKQGRVLCVDDEPMILHVLQALLHTDFSVQVAQSGDEALQLVKRDDFDVVLSDQCMPGMTGAQLLAHVKHVSPRSMRLLMTAYADLPALLSAVNDGEIWHCITKPLVHQDLVDLLHTAVQIAQESVRTVRLPASGTLHDAHILVVSEHETLALALADCQEASTHILRAASPTQAVQVLRSHGVGVLVAEAGVDTTEVTNLLAVVKQQHPAIMSVVVAEHVNVDQFKQLINCGHLYRFILKPPKKDYLQFLVKSAMTTHRQLVANPGMQARYSAAPTPTTEQRGLRRASALPTPAASGQGEGPKASGPELPKPGGGHHLRQSMSQLVGQKALVQRPEAVLSEAGDSGTRRTPTYGFFIQDAMTPDDMVQRHVEATYSRLHAVPLVLAIHETTEVNRTNGRVTKDSGPRERPAGDGLLVCTTLAITPERAPMGLLGQQVWARDPDDMEEGARRTPISSSQKATQQWLHSLDAVFTARNHCPTTRLVSIGNQAADVYDVLAAPRPPGVDLLIRAVGDRGAHASLQEAWTAVTAQPVAAQLSLHVPHRGSHPARQATVTLRYCPWTLLPLPPRTAEGLPDVGVWVVQVCESKPPSGVRPITWLLLTTVAVETVDDARERLQWYTCRRGLEVWRRIVQGGRRLEARPCQHVEHVRRALAYDSILAWRILYVTMLARTASEVPCSVLLAPDEWQALYCAVSQAPTPPRNPPTLGQAVSWIAQLGGFVGCQQSDYPGAEVLWRGFQRLRDLTTMYCILDPQGH